MDCAPLFRNVKIDTKRLILVVGVVISVVLVLQSSSLPYGSIISSLLSFKPLMISHSKPVNGSCCIDSSVANNSVGLNVKKGIQPDSEDLANVSAVGKDQSSSFEPYSEKEGHSVVEVQKSDNEDSKFILGNVSSVGNNFTSQSLAPLPMDATVDWNSLSQSGANSSKDGVSSASTEATKTLSESDNAKQTDVVNSTKSSVATTKTVKKNKRKLPPTTISEMTQLLLQNRVSSRAMRPRWSSVLDQELLFAKSQIEGAPLLKGSAELYPPLYRNVSKFKRSYELMENMLKVYIYNEGEKPIFHQPKLKGIYASEGWFMKQMEGNKQFVVKDPTKAHLFYFPFSAYRLRLAIYVNPQHHKGLAEFLRNYVNIIARKYSFWNRTGGSDHFLVACHDWAPRATMEYMGTCVRALCNANVARDFKIGKDVSLPVTNVRYVDDPLRGLGGKPPSKRPFLAFFAGSMHGRLREILLQYWANKDPDMKIFGPLPQSEKLNYGQYMKSSKYCICAKGYEVHTPRVIEAIFYECVPVIISDNYVPPFFEVLNWEAFSVFILEKDIPNLKNVLLSIPKKRYLELQKRVKMVQKHFLWHKNPVKYDIFHMTLHSIWYNRIFQIKPR